VSASVKWYNRQKGYGFVCEGEGSPECMVHADTLQRWGVAPLCPKQVVEIRWGTGSKGRKVAEIRYPGGSSSFPPIH
jgi:CspA family cold shock protein